MLPSMLATSMAGGLGLADLTTVLKVAPEAVVMPKRPDPPIHPVSGRPSSSTSMICLTVAPVAAPVGLPFGVGAHPRPGDGAVLVGARARRGERHCARRWAGGWCGVVGGAAAERTHAQQRGGGHRFPSRVDFHEVSSLGLFVSRRRQLVIRLSAAIQFCQLVFGD